jgi:hypothetical protein
MEAPPGSMPRPTNRIPARILSYSRWQAPNSAVIFEFLALHLVSQIAPRTNCRLAPV